MSFNAIYTAPLSPGARLLLLTGMAQFGQDGVSGLLRGVDRRVDVHTHGPQAVEHPGHGGHAQAHSLQLVPVGKDLPGAPEKGIGRR